MTRDPWLPSTWGSDTDSTHPFAALRKQMDEVFDTWATSTPSLLGADGNGHFAPRINVSETGSEICVTAELPGVEEKDIDVTLVGNKLTIKGEKRTERDEEKEEGGRHFHRIERMQGSFMRSLVVPDGIDPSNVDAHFKDGVLTVKVPKPAEAVQKTKKIQIRSAAA